ncbi:MraY family glycosyltransferase [Asaia platycodi]|uniref:hypothetical protein n=1 Tax=Asaia platycodi TaxID=610243 RepID=UPI00131ED2D2|nr:hypothetical protein [Asaia platycodi]
MIRIGVMDVPGHRSSHTRPTPKGGGIGIVVGFLLVFPISQLWTQGDLPGVSLLLPLLAIALLALFSWLDDVHSYRASLKLGVQAIAALMVLTGMAFGSMTVTSFSPLILACLLCVGFCWLVYVTNALNFIDGINGLASGSMAISALIMAWFFDQTGQAGLTHAALILAACLLAFLPFNFPQARIFMGDVAVRVLDLPCPGSGLRRLSPHPTRFSCPFYSAVSCSMLPSRWYDAQWLATHWRKPIAAIFTNWRYAPVCHRFW